MKKISPTDRTFETRGEFVLKTLGEVESPVSFVYAEKLAKKRLDELEKIVIGVSTKWFKNKTDLAMVEQTKDEMGRITQALAAKRKKFGVS
jgi:hypothetical protein